MRLLFHRLSLLFYLLIFLFVSYPSYLPCQVTALEIESPSTVNHPQVEETSNLTEDLDPFKLGDGTLNEMSYWKEFLRMMMMLGLILGVVVAIAWFLRKFLNKRVELANEDNFIKILERRNLSQKSMLFLIEVHGKQYIIGDSAAGGTQFFFECSSDVPTNIPTQPPVVEDKDSFIDILQRKINKKSSNLFKLRK